MDQKISVRTLLHYKEWTSRTGGGHGKGTNALSIAARGGGGFGPQPKEKTKLVTHQPHGSRCYEMLQASKHRHRAGGRNSGKEDARPHNLIQTTKPRDGHEHQIA